MSLRRAVSLYYGDSVDPDFDRENFHWGDRPRTKQSHPYSYDMQTVWCSARGVEGNGSAYSDRFILWEYDRYKQIGAALGERWSFEDVDRVEKMLQLYYTGGKTDCGNLTLVRIVEGCNQATGYPVWLFVWVDSHRPAPPAPKVRKRRDELISHPWG